MIITNALYTEIDRLKKRVAELEAALTEERQRNRVGEAVIRENEVLTKENMELTQSRDEWRRIATEAKERVEGLLRDTTKMVKDEDVISDGFGSAWSAYCPMCGKRTMQVVRPGKAQCSKCG